MIGHIAAPAGPIDRNFLRREDVGRIAAASQGVNMRMLDEKQNVRERLSLLDLDEPFLECQRGQVIQLAQVFE
jgi:predicted RNA-binding protein